MTIPHISRLHTRLYLAASQPGALDMRTFECDTAACRAGWGAHRPREERATDDDTDPYEAAGESRFGWPGGGTSL
jgi:hypothetical protein